MANTSIQASGYRTLTSKPGHHQTMIQTLPKTIGLDTDTMIILDTMRKQRNVTDYSGDLVPDTAVKERIKYAKLLRDRVDQWLTLNHPELIK